MTPTRGCANAGLHHLVSIPNYLEVPALCFCCTFGGFGVFSGTPCVVCVAGKFRREGSKNRCEFIRFSIRKFPSILGRNL